MQPATVSAALWLTLFAAVGTAQNGAAPVAEGGLETANRSEAPPGPVVHLQHPGSETELRSVSVSLPWPRGLRRGDRSIGLERITPGLNTTGLNTTGLTTTEPTSANDDAPNTPIPAAGRPLLYWPDGSWRVEQVQARAEVGPGRTSLRAVLGEPVEGPPSEPRPLDFVFEDPASLPIRFELEDPWSRSFSAVFEASDWAVEPGTETARFRIRHARTPLLREAEDGVDEVLLWVEAFLVECRDAPFAELTVVLADDPLPGEPALGPVRFRRFTIECSDRRLRVLPRFRRQLGLRPALVVDDGWRQDLLGETGFLYLGDRTRLAFRLDLVWTGGADQDAIAEARAMVERPVTALPDLEWVRATGAFGPLGGPGPVENPDAAVYEMRRTLGAAIPGMDRGPFGAFGEPRDGLRHGRLRCGPTVLHQVLRSGLPESLSWAEVAVLHHGLRPSLGSPRLPEAQSAVRQGLGPFALRRPHGYAAFDYEHLTAALCFDYYWLTGDPWALSECSRIGAALEELTASTPFPTSRGEGRLLQTAALLSSLSPTAELARRFADRFEGLVSSSLDPARAIVVPQPPMARALGVDHEFDATWQIAEVVRGLAAVARLCDDERRTRLEELQLQVSRSLARDGVLDEGGFKSLISSRDPARFTTIEQDGPLAPTRRLLVDGLVLSIRLASDEDEARRFEELADRLVRGLVAGPEGLADERLRSDRWLQSYFDQKARTPR